MNEFVVYRTGGFLLNTDQHGYVLISQVDGNVITLTPNEAEVLRVNLRPYISEAEKVYSPISKGE